MPTELVDTADFHRLDNSRRLDPKRRSDLGQHMTPAPIGRFMAMLFDDLSGDLRLLDPGAGVGTLTMAMAERCSRESEKTRSLSLACFEIDSVLIERLRGTLRDVHAQYEAAEVAVTSKIYSHDFILSGTPDSQEDLFEATPVGHGPFPHVIMNPPYKRIGSSSDHRRALRFAGIETSNLYTGFMYLVAKQLQEGGEMVAIVPRSFCNGPYFKPFREQFFSMMSLLHVHVFEKRNSAFKANGVLQENIIIHAVKGAVPPEVTVTTSAGADFEFDPVSGACIGEVMTQRSVAYDSVIRPDDPDRFVHIAATHQEQEIADRLSCFTARLADLGLEVSTGPVVDFRLWDDLRTDMTKDSVPLLYASNFRSGVVEWPVDTKKPNAIAATEQSRKWLWPNRGCYVVTRRFTSKEERRRVVATVYPSNLPGELIGFENHLNVFHARQAGVSPSLAVGLCVYLNSSLVDRFFRQFNGHTQVNASDLRSFRYPDQEVLERIGEETDGAVLSQREIDSLIEGELEHMTDDNNPLLGQQKIDESLEILKALGMPRGQQNERSALTLLALLGLPPSGTWQELERPLIGITPVMDYCRNHYGREYAPNTRETFRRQTMHQFVEAGIAVYNPDEPGRPVNSPKACYQITQEAVEAIRTYGTPAWNSALDAYLQGRVTLATKWAKPREMEMIPVQIAEDQEITLTPGAHSELIRQIITEFAPRFAPAA